MSKTWHDIKLYFLLAMWCVPCVRAMVQKCWAKGAHLVPVRQMYVSNTVSKFEFRNQNSTPLTGDSQCSLEHIARRTTVQRDTHVWLAAHRIKWFCIEMNRIWCYVRLVRVLYRSPFSSIKFSWRGTMNKTCVVRLRWAHQQNIIRNASDRKTERNMSLFAAAKMLLVDDVYK